MTPHFRIHHLNCGTMCPFCRRLINGSGGWLERGDMVCHCLLVETPQSLVLVDTGFGTADVEAPRRRLGQAFLASANPRLSRDDTAFEQVRRLGYNPRDVGHIILTHLDLDHAGGLSDFPQAWVHLHRPELSALRSPGLVDRLRYRGAQFAHNPRWYEHDRAREDWFGLPAIRPIPALGSDLLIVPLGGHTLGHAGVAVRDGKRWLLHCGDAYFHHTQLSGKGAMPAGLRALERATEKHPEARRNSLARLQALARDHGDEVELFCAHDPTEMARYEG